jgi:2-polyprenyl-6-methoxyphenol hydroxylase-like FAD-dependent oxidoreductase
MAEVRVPVLIVGAGAAGLATAAVLAWHGVRSLVVEKRREIFLYPKARNLSFRSLEILRGLGLADEVHAVAAGVSDMVVKPTLNSVEERPALDVDAIFTGLDGLSPEPPVQYCPQSRLEPILLRYLRSRGSEARYGVELISMNQDQTGVAAVVRDLGSGRRTELHADYLVAADGVHGRIRTAVGVGTSGHGALPIYMVFVYFRAPWRSLIPHLRDGTAVQVANADVNAIFISAEGDLGMFLTTYFPSQGETAAQFTEQRCREMILRAVGQPIDLDIVDIAPWQPYECVADSFCSGRVFLVGDSAHAMPPLKAGGANAAIQSADNLAWKLAAVLHGWAGPELLDTYHAERHPVGAFSARQSLTGPTLALLNLDSYQSELPVEDEASMFALLAGYQYRSSAVISDPAGLGPSDDVQLVDELRGQPGTRAPHAWVTHRGQRVSTLDLLGPGFTLLTRDATDTWYEAAAQVKAAPLTVHSIGTHCDTVELDNQWSTTTALGHGGALLVRPDGFVGWRTDGLPSNPAGELSQALKAILSA